MKKYLLYIILALTAAGIYNGLSTGDWRLVGVGVSTLFAYAMTPKTSYANGIDIGTIASGVGTATTINLSYCPQFISWIQTAAVDVNVKVLGQGTVYDVPAAGVTELGIVRQVGRFTNQYVLQLADGLMKGYQTTITITNQVASAFTLYGSSEMEGRGFIQGLSQICLANSGIDFDRFYYLSMPSAGATDQITVVYRNSKTNQQYRREEIRSRVQRYQNVINSTGYSIDNIDKEISKVNFIPAAQQTAYLLRYIGRKNADNALISKMG